jgi:hypothetical protein
MVLGVPGAGRVTAGRGAGALGSMGRPRPRGPVPANLCGSRGLTSVIISTNPARAATYIVRLDRPVLCRRGGCGKLSAGEPLGLCLGHLAEYQAAHSTERVPQHYRQHATPARVPTARAARAFAILRAVTDTGPGPALSG